MTTTKPRALSFRSSVSCLALAMGAAALSAPAFAQAKDFDIDKGPAAAALNQLAEQADVSVVYSFDLVEGVTTNDIEGSFETADALEQLVAGTGLVVVNGQGGAYAIRQAELDGASGSQALQTADVNEPIATQTLPAGASGEGEPVAVTGSVQAFGSEANLKGAQVEIVETGQKTATDNLGRFRFSSVAPGEYTLRITYLGRDPIVETIEVDGDGYNQSFAMGSEGTLDTIYVYGSRSARAQALNQERTAENSSTVLSSDFLGQFDGTTIAETLRRAPGVTFEQSEITGEGTNIVVRGLDPDLSQVTLNGLRLPDGSGVGRSPNLNNILTESISKVTINKTLLPSQDSSGAGGLVEIETKSPFDRPRRFMSFSAQGAERGGGFGDEQQFSGILSGTFGKNDQFGLSGTVQYLDSDVKSVDYSVPNLLLGPYLPLSDGGVPLTADRFINPTTPFPFEDGVSDIYPVSVSNSLRTSETKNLSATISASWAPADHTQIHADFTVASVEQSTFSRGGSFGVAGTYELLPIEELGGEIRGALVGEDIFGFSGALGGLSQVYSFSPNQENDTQTISVRGSTDIERWDLKYSAGYASSESSTPFAGSFAAGLVGPNIIDPAFYDPAVLDNTIDGRLVSLFAPLSSSENFVLPLLNAGGFESFNDPSASSFRFLSASVGGSGENERLSSNAQARYNFDQEVLKYIEVGTFFEKADFRSLFGAGSFRGGPVGFPAPTLQQLGFDSYTDGNLSEIGIDGGFDLLSQSEVERFVSNYESIAAQNSDLFFAEGDIPNLNLASGASTEEESLSTYIQGRVDIGRLEVVGGVRFDRVNASATNQTTSSLIDENGLRDEAFAERNLKLFEQSATQTTVLPRIAATYRFDGQLQLRAGYSQSIGRPQIQLLSTQQSIFADLRPFFGPTGDRPTIFISQGNPGLEPSKTSSFDLSAEYYFKDVGQIELSLFYKEISNLIESNTVTSIGELSQAFLPDDPALANLPDNIVTFLSIPVNNPNDAKIWGMEAVFEKQLTFLPGPWSGLGVVANYTYTDSEKVEPFDFFNSDTFQSESVDLTTPFSSDPKHSGTAAVTYNKYNVDASLSYTRQGRRLNGIRKFRLDSFAEPSDTLDFRAEYRFDRFNGAWRVWLAGSDLLRGSDDSTIQRTRGGEAGTPRIFEGATYFGGREFSLGLSTSF